MAFLSSPSSSTTFRAVPALRGSKPSWSSGESFRLTEKEKEWRAAVIYGDFACISRLLSITPELVDWQDYITGNTALHFASKDNDMGLIRLLAGTYKADVEVRNHGGLTPLHMAASTASEEAVFALLSQFGAKASSRDYSGRLPVFHLPQTPKGQHIRCYLRGQVSKLLAENPLLKYLMVTSAAKFSLAIVPSSPSERSEAVLIPTEISLEKKYKSSASMSCGAFSLAYCTGRFRKRSKSSQKLRHLSPARALSRTRVPLGDPGAEAYSWLPEHASPLHENRIAVEEGDALVQKICGITQKQREQMADRFNPMDSKLHIKEAVKNVTGSSPNVRRRTVERSSQRNRTVLTSAT